MTLILIVIAGSLTALGLFRIAQAVLSLPSGSAVDAVQNIHGRRSMAEQLQRVFLPLAGLLSKLFPMSEYKTKRMEADFSRLNICQTPQEYTSALMAKSLLLVLMGLLFIPLGIPWLFLIVAVIAFLSYFNGTQSIRKKVEELNQAIEAELPRLVETLNYSVQDNRDLLAFFEKYRKLAGKALGTELDRLIVDMKTGNQESALRRMDARLGLPSFAALCAVMCGVNQGVDQRVSLLVLEQDMRTKERETLRRSMEKSPARIKAASFILTILMILMFMVPFVLLIISNLQSVGF
jgi:ABC-type multidrug transport system fused ATPase/permease subunit